MSLLPLLIELSDDLSTPSFNHWNNHGRGIYSHQLDSFPSLLSRYYTGYQRHPLLQAALRNSSESAAVPKSSIGKDGFQVCMDVQEFAPNEISVKTVDNTVVVEAKHEERQDEHGYISREFKRRYTLPQGFHIKDVVTQLSSDGILSIKAPPEQKAIDGENVRVLQIHQTGPARLNSGNKDSGKTSEQDAPKK